jgi:hypothetical protein
MKTKMKTSHFVIIMIVAVVIAAYTLMPFFLVCINVFKNANGIPFLCLTPACRRVISMPGRILLPV